MARHIPCVLVTDGLALPPEVAAEAEREGVPLLRTPVATPIAIARLTGFLEDILAERTIVHAVLMEILGLGVLIVGESGIGKSECALDLVLRGHRLVADDTVEIRRRAESVLIGACPELTRYHMRFAGSASSTCRTCSASRRRARRSGSSSSCSSSAGRRAAEAWARDHHFEISTPGADERMPVAPGRIGTW
jgi:serine kinase of HPr protein (carbohydrate metabolism regulator)